MDTGERRWYIIGCYIAPDYISMIESVVAALKERPWGSELLVTGDLNEKLDHPEGDRREEEITAALTAAGLEDMSAHFLPRRHPWCRDGRTWIMVKLGREVRSLTDYIMGIYRRIFRIMNFQDPRHNLDHYMVVGCLQSAPLR